MKFKHRITVLFTGLLLSTFTFGQTAKPTEYLGVAEPISFDKFSYNLA